MPYPKVSRNLLLAAAVAAMIPAFSPSAAAQSAPQQPPANTSKNNLVQVSANQQDAKLQVIAPQQQPSLADLARIAREKKNAAPAKTAKVIDDDNLSKTPRDAAEMALDASFSAVPQGQPQSSPSSAHAGKVTLLDFWATWCGPCRQSLPDLKQLQATYGSDRLEVVSISEDHDEGTWRNFVSQNGMNWTQRFDADGTEMHRYGANALPTYIVLDSNGAVLGRLVGEDPSMPLTDRLAPILSR